MTFASPEDTLAFHQSRALTAKRDMREVPLKTVVKQFEALTMSEPDLVAPELAALWFYGMNHGLALIRRDRDPLEPLQGRELVFVQDYHRRLGPIARRAFSYLLATCTREARHCHTTASVGVVATPADLPPGSSDAALMEARVAVKWLLGSHGGEDGIYGALLKSPPSVSIGAYARALSIVFRKGKWSSSYGGPAWANISDCLCRFVEGEYSAEMMLDTVWTLEHNTCNLMNKGILFKCFTGFLSKILDVQRSGQIPELMLEGVPVAYADTTLLAHMVWLRERFEGDVMRYVDWFKVQALGAVSSYSGEQDAQVVKHGPSKWMSEQHLKAAEAALLKKAAADKHALEWFHVMPGVEVKFKKIKRAA